MTGGFTGMAALIRDLELLGPRVQQAAGNIAQHAAQQHRAAVLGKYPRRTGRLQNGVVVESTNPLRWTTRSKAPHANLFESGTMVRRTHSTGANRGRMTAANVFKPEAQRARAEMVRAMIGLVERQTVAGMTGRLTVREA